MAMKFVRIKSKTSTKTSHRKEIISTVEYLKIGLFYLDYNISEFQNIYNMAKNRE